MTLRHHGRGRSKGRRPLRLLTSYEFIYRGSVGVVYNFLVLRKSVVVPCRGLGTHSPRRRRRLVKLKFIEKSPHKDSDSDYPSR